MIRNFLILFFLIGQISIFAQLQVYTYPITFQDKTILNYNIDFVDSSIVQTKGVHLNWDLSGLETPIYEEVEIVKQEFKINNKIINHKISDKSSITFYRKNRRHFDEIGFVLFPYTGHSHYVTYDKPINFSTTKLIYGAVYSNSTTFSVEIERTELPHSILANLPASVQNIKIVGKITRRYHCDADGKFILNSKNTPALRLKIVENIEIRLYDVLSGNEIPNITNSSLNKIYKKIGKSKYYLFFSNSSKLYFAKVEYSKSSKSYMIKYQTDIKSKKNYKVNNDKKTFLIYPNPTYNIAKFLISKYKPGNYKIEVYNIIGKKQWASDVHIEKNTMLKYDFSFLRKGTYLIVLKDRFGKAIQTKKLMIISI